MSMPYVQKCRPVRQKSKSVLTVNENALTTLAIGLTIVLFGDE